jgi:hypothetical protein
VVPIDIAEEVSALIRETKRVERESETLYLEFGRLFPRLSEEMQRSADIAEQSIHGLDELESTGKRAGGRTFIEDARSFFQSLYARDSAFLSVVTEGIKRLSSLEEIISHVRADSEEMELISLNAMTFALKSGTVGKAFSVITDELKRLAGATIAHSERITITGRTLLDSFTDLRGRLSELGEFQQNFFYGLYESIGKGYETIESSLSQAAVFFASLLAEARRVREPVLRVMGEIQLQDIIRQSLQHVAISLGEAEAASVTGEKRDSAFIAAVAELSEDLIDDIAGKIDSSAGAFASNLDTIRDLVDSCERRRSDFLSDQGGLLDAVDTESFGRGSERYLELKREVLEKSSRLAAQVKTLDESFKGLATLLTRFQNIVVASRIEVAKTRALAGVANTVAGMVELTGRIASDVETAMEMTKEFIKLTHGAFDEFSAGEEADDARLLSVLAVLGEGITALQTRRDTIRGAVGSFALYTDDFISLVERARGDMKSLRLLGEGLLSVGGRLGSLKNALREGLSSAEIEPEPERMRKMVERFTIFTHKKAAADIGNFDVEEGRQSGEVTLF